MLLTRLAKRRLIPSALLFAACPSPSVMDGGAKDPCADYDAGHDDSGVRCFCNSSLMSDGTYAFEQCCDPDIGNPCPICCENPRDADGGRLYEPNDAGPVCFC